MRSTGTKGFTLIEVAVYSGLLSLLLTGIYLLLISGLGFVRKGAAYQTAQQQSLVGIRWMTHDISNGTAAQRSPALTPTSDADHIIFLSPETADNGPWTYLAVRQLEYYRWVCFYWNSATNELVRTAELLGTQSIASTAGAAPALATMQGVVDPNLRRVIARNVVDLKINEGSQPDMVLIEISCEEATASDKVTRVTYRGQVRMENI